MKVRLLTVMSLLAIATPLAAETTVDAANQALPSFDDRWYLSPFAAYTWADEDRGTDDGAGFGLAVGKPINQWFNLELRATYTNLVSKRADTGIVGPNYVGAGDFEVGDIALDGLFFLNRGAFQPFLLAGIGAISDDFSCDHTQANRVGGCESGSSKWSFMAEAGAGVLVPITEEIALRVDGRYRYDDNSSNLRDASEFGDWVVTAGISIPIGARAKPVVTRTFELSADTLFGFNKDTLSATGVTTVGNFARDLGDKANYATVRVDGHTDPIGSDSFNQDLSDRRANRVRDQLVTDGVPSDRVSAQGFGESRLKITEAECASAGDRAAKIECLQPNRRVEITVDGMTAK